MKAAIAAAKARGVVWGGHRNAPTAHLDEARRVGNEGRRRRAIARAIDLEPVIMELRESGKSLKGMAAELSRLGIRQSPRRPSSHLAAIRTRRSAHVTLFHASAREGVLERRGHGRTIGLVGKIGLVVQESLQGTHDLSAPQVRWRANYPPSLPKILDATKILRVPMASLA
jgi:hypothetical protein